MWAIIPYMECLGRHVSFIEGTWVLGSLQPWSGDDHLSDPSYHARNNLPDVGYTPGSSGKGTISPVTRCYTPSCLTTLARSAR